MKKLKETSKHEHLQMYIAVVMCDFPPVTSSQFWVPEASKNLFDQNIYKFPTEVNYVLVIMRLLSFYVPGSSMPKFKTKVGHSI